MDCAEPRDIPPDVHLGDHPGDLAQVPGEHTDIRARDCDPRLLARLYVKSRDRQLPRGQLERERLPAGPDDLQHVVDVAVIATHLLSEKDPPAMRGPASPHEH